MSSPPLNCFLAAARTASLIASITKSRSMPCSWQRASMFCAMLVLIQFCFCLNQLLPEEGPRRLVRHDLLDLGPGLEPLLRVHDGDGGGDLVLEQLVAA